MQDVSKILVPSQTSPEKKEPTGQLPAVAPFVVFFAFVHGVHVEIVEVS